MDSKQIALIISAGEQDIKRWVKIPADDKDRKATERFSGRKVHQWLVEGHEAGASPCYRFALPDELEQQRPTTVTLSKDAHAFPAGRCGERLKKLSELFSPKDLRSNENILVDQAGNALLCPAKVEFLVRDLRVLSDAGSLKVQRVLVFATDRIAPETLAKRLPDQVENRDTRLTDHRDRYLKEPFAGGQILARWLADFFGLSYQGEDLEFSADGGAAWCNILSGLASYEGEPGSPDHPLHRQVARFVDDALASVAKGFDDGYALVSVTGGFDDVKPCILASASLRFPHRCVEYPEPEGGGRFDLAMLDREPPYVTPTVSLAARGHCADLLRRGDVAGAWGAVAHLRASEPDRRWLEAVQALDVFLRGGGLGPGLIPGLNPATLAPGIALFLQRAFQVEAALQGEARDRRIPEALVGVCALSEQALFLLVGRALAERCDLTLDVGLARILRGDVPLSPKDLFRELQQFAPGFLSPHEWSRWLEKESGSGRYAVVRTDGLSARRWREWLLRAGDDGWSNAGQALERLECFLHADGDRGGYLRGYRNQQSHAVLTTLQEEAVWVLATRGVTCGEDWKRLSGVSLGPLWTASDWQGPWDVSRLGTCFLASPLIEDVAKALGCPALAGLYRTTLEKVLEAVAAPVAVEVS